jgi:amino acid transporter
MEIKTLRCNNCGSNLNVSSKVKFLNCSFCGSSLTIKNSGNATFTEVIHEIKENTEILVNSSERMAIEKEIERLDREWLIERERYKIKSKHSSDLPDNSTIITSIIGLILGFIFILFMMQNAPYQFIIFGIVFMLILVFSTISNIIKTTNYNNAKDLYNRKRKNLSQQL